MTARKGEHDVHPRGGHQIRLELRAIDVEPPVEAERRGQRADHLLDQPVKARVRGTLDVGVEAADVALHHARRQLGAGDGDLSDGELL